MHLMIPSTLPGFSIPNNFERFARSSTDHPSRTLETDLAMLTPSNALPVSSAAKRRPLYRLVIHCVHCASCGTQSQVDQETSGLPAWTHPPCDRDHVRSSPQTERQEPKRAPPV